MNFSHTLQGDDHSRVRLLGPGGDHRGETLLGSHRGGRIRLLRLIVLLRHKGLVSGPRGYYHQDLLKGDGVGKHLLRFVT